MYFDLNQSNPREIYNLLIGLVAPRPIALVSTLSGAGELNVAPFSAYNYLGVDPPIIGLGVANRPGTGSEVVPKDTARNVRETGEFVVNVVTEAIAERMNVCSTDFPHGVNEAVKAGFTTRPSMVVKVPRIFESPASLECKEVSTLEIGRSRVILGRVVAIWVEDKYLDPAGPYIKCEELHQIGRMNGRGSYVKTNGAFFNITRPESGG